MDIQTTIINQLAGELNKKFEEYFIHALKRKGFTFSSRLEMEQFIKDNCRCEDNTEIKERVYFVKDMPFFLHRYRLGINIETGMNDFETTVKGDYGSFSYL